jgi:imidazolonepropionase-like amidohydrolase
MLLILYPKTHTINEVKTMKKLSLLLTVMTIFLIAVSSFAQEHEINIPPVTLFKNVNVWDGTSDSLKKGYDVLVVRNLIKKVAKDIPTTATYEVDAKRDEVQEVHVSIPGDYQVYTIYKIKEGGTREKIEVPVAVIDGGGRTLLPGLIDMHVHLHVAMVLGGVPGLEQMGWQEIGARAVARANDRLLEGFTTVRDMGGTDGGFKKVFDDGTLAGPRIYPSGAYISQTSGHFDLRLPTMRNPSLTPHHDSNINRLGIAIIADGVDAVMAAVRQNLSQGATQIKLANSGGVVSTMDPLHTRQYTMAELRAAVQTAEDWGTYVATHSIPDGSVKRALEAGVKSIEHAAFITEETARLVKENNAYLSVNLTAYSNYALQIPHMKVEPSKSKMEAVVRYGEDFKRVIDKVQPKMVFSTDVVGGNLQSARQHRDHEKWLHAEFFGNLAMLRAATSTAGELLSLTGPLNPYPHKLGVIEPGAYADILIVDGNPLEDITVIGGNAKWFDAKPRKAGIETIRMIMKDGEVYKNTL